MKMVKSLLLGTAAGLVAMTGAQAADLPVKAKPVQYVKICSLYGAGFYYIPGTDTCIKIGGWVRAEYNLNSPGSFAVLKSNAFTRNTTQNAIRARAMITVDTRSQTEYGTLRSYIASGWNTTNNADALYVPRAFIQLGGFTFGKAQSFYDFYSTPAYSNTTNVWGSDTGGGGDTVAAYTAQLGNGLSATISLEDPLVRRTAIRGATVTTTSTSTTVIGTDSLGGAVTAAGATSTSNSGYAAGPEIPEIVANLRLDQAWGSAQIMGAAHQLQSSYYGTTPGTGHPSDSWGYAVGGGLTVKLPMLGAGDSISTEVNYTEGALKYAGGGLSDFLISHGATTGGGLAVDASFAAAGGLDKAKAWSVVGGYQHSWNSQWKTSLYGTYGSVDLPVNTATVAGADWEFWQVGSRTIWTPVTNLDLSVDVMYNKLQTATAGLPSGTPTGNTIADQSTWQAIFRVQRNFWP